jgi:CheY-like chemotaxis protein
VSRISNGILNYFSVALDRNGAARHDREMAAAVLVVDDDPLMRKAAQRCLAPLAVEVVDASTAAEALARAAERRFDLVLLDLNLVPDCGLDVLKALRGSALPPLTVVMMSGAWTDGARQKALDLGAAAAWDKPFDFSDLRPLVAAHLPSPNA